MIEGGPAIFAVVAINHHIHMLGNRVRRPLVKNRLRVEVVSYVIPARENMEGEDKPWASIIAKAPLQPQSEREVEPATTRAIWATDE